LCESWLKLTAERCIMRKKQPQKDTLIALLKEKRDLGIARRELWYRIPVKSAPTMVKTGKIKYLALYQPGVFKDAAFQIKWYGRVKKITVAKRKELLPHEPFHPNADEDYYKVEFEELFELSQPIFSRRRRRVLFITTTYPRFINARELNNVFYESPLEETFWQALQAENITAERQYMVEAEEDLFFLDFAIFSKQRNIDVECDGDKHHSAKPDVKRDKRRNNILESKGWSVLRYTTDDISKNLDKCIRQVKETINRYGGLQDIEDSSRYRYLSVNDDNQLSLFD